MGGILKHRFQDNHATIQLSQYPFDFGHPGHP